MNPIHPLPRIFRSLTLALAVLSHGLIQAAPIDVVSYTYDGMGDGTQPNTVYVAALADTGGTELTDGDIPTYNWSAGSGWVGFYNDPLPAAGTPHPQITFDLGTSCELSSVALTYLAGDSAGAFPATSLGDTVRISVSTNGTDFTAPVSYSPFSGPTTGFESTTSVMDLSGKSGRYVRMHVQCHHGPVGSWVC